jgi:hypothetical protein
MRNSTERVGKSGKDGLFLPSCLEHGVQNSTKIHGITCVTQPKPKPNPTQPKPNPNPTQTQPNPNPKCNVAHENAAAVRVFVSRLERGTGQCINP